MISAMSESPHARETSWSAEPVRRAAIIAVGSEMLGAEKLDTNSLKLTASLERFGVSVVEKVVIGDDEGDIAAALARLAAAMDVLVVTGGLGPTRDDCTRAAAAEAFGRTVAIDPSLVESIRQRFAAFGREMPAVNRRQAEVIEGAEVLNNPRGTAPGQRIGTAGADTSGATVFLFPGVPREVKGMISGHLEPWLAARNGDAATEILRHVMKVACVPESAVEERLAPFYQRWGREPLAVLARPGDVRLELRLTGPTEAENEPDRDPHQALAAMTADLEALLRDVIYGVGPEATLEGVVVAALRAQQQTLAIAESCTGGLLGSRITQVAGASEVFLGGAITYANALKSTQLGVPEAVMVAHGAVSEPVARRMAQGACHRFGANFGIGITGIAGPGGGTDEKPVGTVHIALAGPCPVTERCDPDELDGAQSEIPVVHRSVRFPGSREMVRWQASQLALELLRRALQSAGVPAPDAPAPDTLASVAEETLPE